MRGSVKKYEGKQGTSWYDVIDVGVKPDGRRAQKKQRGFATKRAAEEAMRQELHRRREGSYVEPSKLTVAGFLGEWLHVAAAGVQPATVYSHRTIAGRRIVPHLGVVPPAQSKAASPTTQVGLVPRDDGEYGVSGRDWAAVGAAVWSRPEEGEPDRARGGRRLA